MNRLKPLWQIISYCINLRQIRFLMVGGFNTIASYLVFLLTEAVFEYRAALILTYIIGINISIITMRYLVFQSNVPLRRQYYKAALTYVLMLLCNYVFLYLTVDCLGEKPWIAQGLFTVISTIALYFLHKEVNFKNLEN